MELVSPERGAACSHRPPRRPPRRQSPEQIAYPRSRPSTGDLLRALRLDPSLFPARPPALVHALNDEKQNRRQPARSRDIRPRQMQSPENSTARTLSLSPKIANRQEPEAVVRNPFRARKPCCLGQTRIPHPH